MYNIGKDVLVGIGLGLLIAPLVLLSTNTFNINSALEREVVADVAGIQESASESYIKPNTLQIEEAFAYNAQSAQEYAITNQEKALHITDIPKTKLLQVPLIRQIYTLSCEAASLQMALAFHGIEVSQDELIARIGTNGPMKMQTLPNGQLLWGDPDKGFVGDYKGRFWSREEGLRGATGWGVNNHPIERVARQYAPRSKAVTNMSISQLKLELANNNPVIFWHVRDDATRKETIQLVTEEGKNISFFQNHVGLIVGYNQREDGIVEYTINDPEFGVFVINETDLVRIWTKYERDAVVVQK